jgi:hypothetical protein
LALSDERRFSRKGNLEADDGSRTRDLELGKLALYQLSYVRVGSILVGGGVLRFRRCRG